MSSRGISVRRVKMMYKTKPHGAHEVWVIEDAIKFGNRIYEIQDIQGHIALTGEELQSLQDIIYAELKRDGRDE